MSAPSIIIVEDEKDVREVMAEMMSYFGYDTLIVPSGEDALNSLRDRNFDLIITDLGLPGIDGRELVRRIRLGGIDTPILITTGVELENNKTELERYASCDFIQKPFKVDDLNLKISELLQQKNKKVRDMSSYTP